MVPCTMICVHYNFCSLFDNIRDVEIHLVASVEYN
jgi:hypothetical protein